jgi:tetratricopeptide (TPR) repeat protein
MGRSRKSHQGKTKHTSKTRKNRSGSSSLISKQTISACLMVKNEEEMLPRCLTSLAGWVDEIVLVDTGSEDRTLEIAREFGCKIFHFEWCDDFSAARNETLRHATGDWLFVIDADEEVPSGEGEKIRRSINQSDYNVISVSVYNKSLTSGKVSSFLPSIRLFRRALNLRYKGIVHNLLPIPEGVKAARIDAKIFHYGYDLSREKMDRKLARSRALLEKQLKDAPDSIFANFNMAQLLRGMPESSREDIARKILEHAGRVVGNPEADSDKFRHYYLMALHQMASAYQNLKQYDEAEKCCIRALDQKSDYLDAILMRGHLCALMERFDEAATWYERYLQTRDGYRADNETASLIQLNLESRHAAWYGLGAILDLRHDHGAAEACFQKVLHYRDGYLDTYLRLGKLSLDRRKPEQAKRYFTKQLSCSEKQAEAWFGLAEAALIEEDLGEAIRCYRESVALDDGNLETALRLGQVLVRNGQVEEARSVFGAATQRHSGNAQASLRLAAELTEAGFLDEAMDAYSTYLEKRPDDPEGWLGKGNCQYAHDDFEGARESYQKALDLGSLSSVCRRNLGLAEARAGRTEAAIETLSTYLALTDDDPEVQFVVGDLLMKCGRYAEAVPRYEEYIRHNPKDDNGFVHLAEAYYQMQIWPAARLGFRQALTLDPTCRAAQVRLEELDRVAAPV